MMGNILKMAQKLCFGKLNISETCNYTKQGYCVLVFCGVVSTERHSLSEIMSICCQ